MQRKLDNSTLYEVYEESTMFNVSRSSALREEKSPKQVRRLEKLPRFAYHNNLSFFFPPSPSIRARQQSQDVSAVESEANEIAGDETLSPREDAEQGKRTEQRIVRIERGLVYKRVSQQLRDTRPQCLPSSGSRRDVCIGSASLSRSPYDD